jgi:chorismate mutase
VSAHADDPTLAELRVQIDQADREILAAFLRRLDAARQVRRHKAEQGYAFIDAGREAELLQHWIAVADGALPDDTVRELFEAVLALSKREATR